MSWRVARFVGGIVKNSEHIFQFGEICPTFWYYQARVQMFSIELLHVLQGVYLSFPPFLYRIPVFVFLLFLEANCFSFKIPVETYKGGDISKWDVFRPFPGDSQPEADFIDIVHRVCVLGIQCFLLM